MRSRNPLALDCIPVSVGRRVRRSLRVRADAAPSTQALRGWQRRALVQVPDRQAAGLPGRGDPGLRQDDLRAAHRRRTARRGHRRAGHRRRAHRAPQDPVGAGRRAASGIALDPKFCNSNAQTSVGVPRRRRHLRPGRQPPDPAPGAHREPQDAGRSSTRSTTAATPRVGARPSARRSTTRPAGWR